MDNEYFSNVWSLGRVDCICIVVIAICLYNSMDSNSCEIIVWSIGSLMRLTCTLSREVDIHALDIRVTHFWLTCDAFLQVLIRSSRQTRVNDQPMICDRKWHKIKSLRCDLYITEFLNSLAFFLIEKNHAINSAEYLINEDLDGIFVLTSWKIMKYYAQFVFSNL